MRLLVTYETRLQRTQRGVIHACSTPVHTDRYLQVFDEVVVFARVEDVPADTLDRWEVAGSGVTVYPLPYYVGPWQYLRQRSALKRLARAAIDHADAFMLRAPGAVAGLLWRAVRQAGIPYGVEVVGDPWDVFAPGVVSGPMRPLIRRKFASEQRRQCRDAAVAAYVTQYALQRRYPTCGWATHYSSIHLPDDRIVSDEAAESRAARMAAKRADGTPITIVTVGSLAQRYKAPDVLIKAAAQILRAGQAVEIVIVGDGRFRAEFELLAAELGISQHVHFRGILAEDGVNRELDNADIFALPSLTEGLPRVVIEAMARGLPCVASNVGGTGELLPPEDLVAPGDPAGLAARLEALMNEPRDACAARIRRNLARARDYAVDVLDARRKECYEKLREITAAWQQRQQKRT